MNHIYYTKNKHDTFIIIILTVIVFRNPSKLKSNQLKMAQMRCYKLEAGLHGQSLKCNLMDVLSRELGQSQREIHHV